MNNNNKRCPICRSELLKQTCKKCGYKENKIKIGQNQETFGKLNYMNKIQHSQTITKNKMQITSQQIDLILVKLKLYLKAYVKIMKEGVKRICDKKDFTIQEKRRLENEVFQIWKRYILKIKKLNLNIGGIFKKYIFSKNKKPEQQSKNNIQKIQDEQLNSEQKNELKSQERLTQIPLKRQRKRRSKKQQPQTDIITDPKSHFRSYYLISVKPLIPQSQQQRRNDKKCLTKCQKHFLSYLLQQKEVDDQFLQLISNKYIKMLQILRKQKNDAYLKQKQILYELKLRNRNLQQKKYHSLLLILLVDIIICLSLSSVHLQQTINLAQLLEFYRSSSYNNYFINTILSQLSQEQQKDDHNIPIINYQLIYSIIYLGCLRGGKCITISEVLHNCGVLEIQQIIYSQGKQDVILPPVYNQEHLSCPKIRRNSHLLKEFLSIDIKLFPLKWSHKWCLKFKIQHHLKQIQYLNNMLLRQASLNKQKIGFNLHQQMQNNGKTIKYVRCIELQQDIACLAGIIVYLKLTNGLTLYPYLINFITNPKFQSLCQQTQIDNINFTKTLIQNKKIFIKNPQDNLFTQKYLPHPYQHQLNINLPQLSETLTKIRLTDKQYNISMLNKNILKIVNLADLNYLSSNQILTYLARLKKIKLGGEDSQYELTLRYNSNSFKGFCREGKTGVKKHKNDGILCEKSNKLRLNKHLLRQIEVIKKQQQQWTPYNIPSEDNIKQSCLLDYPSSNYQIILEYTNDNLILSQRQSQLHIIQLFCLNLCSYNQLTNWLSKYQSILKEYQK